jgi:hypothetical protein
LVGFDVWSDGHTVYAVASGNRLDLNVPVAPTIAPEPEPEPDAGVIARPEATQLGTGVFDQTALTQLWANDGRRWRLVLHEINASAMYSLRGAPSAWIALHDRGYPPETAQFTGPVAITNCTLGLLKGRNFECQELDPVQDMAVVAPNLAHVLSGDRRILSFDGERWHGVTPLTPFPASRLWADDSSILAVGRAGSVMWFEDNTWRSEDLGTVDHFTAVFGNSRNDIWAGTRQGSVYHYDGRTWTERGRLDAESCDHTLPITHIWGSGDQVYFTTEAQFARWTGTALESLGSWQCLPVDVNSGPGPSPIGNGRTITGLWGNAPDEVFLAIADPSEIFTRACASVFVVRYDGKEFHRM